MLAALERAAWATPAAGVASVLFVIPGLVLLYGRAAPGCSSRTMASGAFLAAVAVAAQWLLAGRWLVFGPGTDLHPIAGAGATVAALLPALAAYRGGISRPGGIAFAVVWSTVVFDPLLRSCAHGWLRQIGLLDAAWVLPVHLGAGVGALACGSIVDRRSADGPAVPRRALMGGALVALGCAALAVVGVEANGPAPAGAALASVTIGAAGGALGALAVGWRDGGAAPSSNMASAALAGVIATSAGAGLVAGSASFAIGWIAGAVGVGTPFAVVAASLGSVLAITAAAGYVPPAVAIGIGCYVASLCFFAVWVKRRVVGRPGSAAFSMHALAGLLGVLLTGVFAEPAASVSGGALFGHFAQLTTQLAACAVVVAYSAVATRLVAYATARAGRARPGHDAGRAVDLVGERRAIWSSGVFQSRLFDAERVDVESLSHGRESDAARVLKS